MANGADLGLLAGHFCRSDEHRVTAILRESPEVEASPSNWKAFRDSILTMFSELPPIRPWVKHGCLTIAVTVITLPSAAYANVQLRGIIGDQMVMQRDRPIELHGVAAPREVVSAILSPAALGAAAGAAEARATVRADARGQWLLTLPAHPAGGPYSLLVEGQNRLAFSDIWFGEVWLASGQSNMEMALHRSLGADLATRSDCAGLRLFTIAHDTALEPATRVRGTWSMCNSREVTGFSAIAFYFGRELQRALGVPIGLIQSAWGGTPAQSWTPRAALLAQPGLAPLVHDFERAVHDPDVRAKYQQTLNDWEIKTFVHDDANRGEALGFARPDASLNGWSTMAVPQFWERAGLNIDGATWFRREVDLPPSFEGQDLTLSLGALDDFDVTYFNGERVGATGVETPQFWSFQRQYRVDARLVRRGRNVIAVRVFDRGGDGGFAGPPDQLFVKPVHGLAAIALTGDWRYRVERGVPPVTIDWNLRPALQDASDPTSPTVLWNAMLAPFAGMPLAGVIWYQGESDVGRASQYRTLFPTMIRAWRDAWAQPTLPFLFVQLPNYGGVPQARATPLGQSSWADLREAQTSALRLPHTAMAVAIDVGDSNDIHPRNKYEVARRLALLALRDVYRQNVLASGPVFRALVRDGQALRVRFASVNGGLRSNSGSKVQGFLIAGADRVWQPAEAFIEGDAVVVSSAQVASPVAVRYAWADDPTATLRDAADLPAAPFRTDAW
jgi:sialate O-acetylesterase